MDTSTIQRRVSPALAVDGDFPPIALLACLRTRHELNMNLGTFTIVLRLGPNRANVESRFPTNGIHCLRARRALDRLGYLRTRPMSDPVARQRISKTYPHRLANNRCGSPDAVQRTCISPCFWILIILALVHRLIRYCSGATGIRGKGRPTL